MVRTNVAKSEFTFSTPIFAKMAVSAANPADRTAQSCQETSADFIDGPHGVMAQDGRMPAERVLRRYRMGMGSPDNRRKADDSYQALCVGRSMSALLHPKQLV